MTGQMLGNSCPPHLDAPVCSFCESVFDPSKTETAVRDHKKEEKQLWETMN